MTFGSPDALVALLALPVIVALLFVAERRRRAQTARFGNPALLAAIAPTPRRFRRLLPRALALAALATLIVGVARPRAMISAPRRQATVVLTIDTSRSMAATDVSPSRLAAALAAAREFIDHAPAGYSVGLVTFSTRATVILPPTTDRDLARASLAQIRLGEGTALGDAIELSVAAARGTRSDRKPGTAPPPAAVLLLSDGEQTSGTSTPLAAAALARNAGIPVNTIALGTREAVVQVPLANGLKERVIVAPDTATLRKVAAATGGRYEAAPTAQRLRSVYHDLGTRVGTTRERREVTAGFAGAGIVLLLIASGLSLAWSRRPL